MFEKRLAAFALATIMSALCSGRTDAQCLNDDFSVVYDGLAAFSVRRNQTCECAGRFIGNGSALTGLSQNPAFASLASQAATQAAACNASIAAQQAQLNTQAAAISTNLATITSLQAQATALSQNVTALVQLVRNSRAGTSKQEALSSCKAIIDANPVAASGYYWITRSTPAAAFLVFCDHITDGGGWTQVFRPTTGDYTPSTQAAYVPGVAGSSGSLISESASMMFAFADKDNQLTYPWKFPTPSQFFATSPMMQPGCMYITITATRISDGTVHVGKVLRSGIGTFSSGCDENCPAGSWGQICLKSNPTQGAIGGYMDFPHFSGYYAATTADYCAQSAQTYNAGTCTPYSSQFVIYVR